MAERNDQPSTAMTLMQAIMLLRASNDFYQGMLDAVRDNTGPGGAPDFPGLFEQMNGAMTSFAPRVHAMRQLLSRFDD